MWTAEGPAVSRTSAFLARVPNRRLYEVHMPTLRFDPLRIVRSAALILALVAPNVSSAQAFGSLVEQLSEPGGDFGGDNLISNEQSYLRVLPELKRRQVTGGAYVGVGPDQNFTYIAQVGNRIAAIADFTQAIAIRPESAEVYVNRAVLPIPRPVALRRL